MQRSGTVYTIGFAAVVCVVCSALVAGAAYTLKPKQQKNIVLDRQRQVLQVTGLVDPDQTLPASEVQQVFGENIEVRYVDLDTDAYVDEAQIPDKYDPVRAAKDPALSTEAPKNPAGVQRLPKYAMVYQVVDESKEVEMLVFQVWGQGLWSTMYGYLALDKDGQTIKGLTFYDQAETPGLGGEVDNPKWKAQWPGRTAYGTDGEPAIIMRKGGAGSIEEDPHGFDAISGATITSRGVQNLLNFWLSDAAYGGYIGKLRGGAQQVASN